jgi:hypothetical protein
VGQSLTTLIPIPTRTFTHTHTLNPADTSIRTTSMGVLCMGTGTMGDTLTLPLIPLSNPPSGLTSTYAIAFLTFVNLSSLMPMLNLNLDPIPTPQLFNARSRPLLSVSSIINKVFANIPAVVPIPTMTPGTIMGISNLENAFFPLLVSAIALLVIFDYSN